MLVLSDMECSYFFPICFNTFFVKYDNYVQGVQMRPYGTGSLGCVLDDKNSRDLAFNKFKGPSRAKRIMEYHDR